VNAIDEQNCECTVGNVCWLPFFFLPASQQAADSWPCRMKAIRDAEWQDPSVAALAGWQESKWLSAPVGMQIRDGERQEQLLNGKP